MHCAMDARNRSRVGVFILSFPLLWFLLTIQYCTATDTLTQSQQISVGQTLISSGQIFELGFFTPSNSSKQYIGIWYKNISGRRVLWVANRENPLAATDSTSSLIIDGDGNLKLLNGMKNTVWSANVSVQSNSTIAVLTDKGNFVLQDNISGKSLWESFNYPCDTFLPGMMIGMNTKTGVKSFLSSWLKENDPSPGKFTCGLTLDTPPQGLVWIGSEPYWRGGPWNGLGFVGIQETTDGYGNVFRLIVDNLEGFEYLTFNTYNISFVTIAVITSAGSWEIMKWNEETNTWDIVWLKPGHPCDTYGFCGPFGFCNRNDSQTCECLKGFVPKSSEDWSKGTWSGGCVRKTELFCEKNTSRSTSGKAGNDGFWKMSGMKLADHFEFLYNEDSSGCQQWCLGNCSCVAYSYVAGIGCMVWGGGLLDMEQFSSAGEDLFLRLAHSELVDDKKKEKLIISFTTSSGVFLLGAIMYGLHRWRSNQRDTQQNQVKQQDALELPMFDFNQIVAATNNFCPNNKLGQGGFGPVIKGKLQDGQEIAVKRLSRFSGQGIEEFKNEIILISKLQHRNLVRLLGCCIAGEEMLIVYEYMANKSLDTFLFDPDKKRQLDWAKRFNIIQGIARGLLYLHRDSCLKIIHRDLKASNVLLDKDMNPKISDFGLARTFLRSQELANTRRVVGTYGYMSPEYALGGIFSEKSDVFSFGVLLLEIICSRKNTSFNYRDQYTSLLGYAWELWNEGRALDFVDEALVDSCSLSEVMRCIHIGLLCVQDHAPDRPTMSTIILILSSEIDGPQPKKPTFTFQSLLITDHQPQNDVHCTNDVTTSIIEGR